MQQVNPALDKVKEIQIVAGLKVIETEYRVKVPVFEDVHIDRPVFVDKKIELPVGFEAIANEMALKIADRVMDNILLVIDARLDRAIDQRIKEITYPKLVEELKVTIKEVDVEKPVYIDVEVQRPVFKDYEVINPVRKDVEVINAVIADKTVINAIIKDVQMTNAIIKDVEVERAIIREKVVDVIHPRYLNMKGEPDVS